MTCEQDTDWEAVCYSFYHACGGMLGCGDVDADEDLIIKYQTYFEEPLEEDDDDSE